MPVNLHYHAFGEGRPIMILHGLFGSSRNWQSIAKKLADNFRIITVDLRNHGQSGHTSSMTYADMAEDIHAFIQTFELNDVSVIGHSMGGKVAMMTALQYKNLIDKLIVIDIAPVKYAHTYEKLFLAMENLPLNKIKNRNEAEKFLDAQINDRWLTQFILQNLRRDVHGFQWQLNLPAIKTNVVHINEFPESDNEAQFDRPTLFLGGEKSDFIRAEHHPAIQNLFPQSQIQILEEAGHMLHIDKPEELLDRIKNFVGR